jgi:Protein of unknown function (DUF1569)
LHPGNFHHQTALTGLKKLEFESKMKNLHQSEAIAEILNRLDKLKIDAPAQWGKMNASQMVAHCANAIEVPLGIRNPKRTLLGKVLGGFFKADYLSEKPMGKNAPTHPDFIIKNTPDFEKERDRLKQHITAFSKGPEAIKNDMHAFFGKFTVQEWAQSGYKHIDHHLKQFNA